MAAMKQIMTRWPEELIEQIDAAAKAEGKDRSTWLREAAQVRLGFKSPRRNDQPAPSRPDPTVVSGGRPPSQRKARGLHLTRHEVTPIPKGGKK